MLALICRKIINFWAGFLIEKKVAIQTSCVHKMNHCYDSLIVKGKIWYSMSKEVPQQGKAARYTLTTSDLISTQYLEGDNEEEDNDKPLLILICLEIFFLRLP